MLCCACRHLAAEIVERGGGGGEGEKKRLETGIINGW